jgi:L-alanine-DL-glutamate epimerase-like enolase superfamily enzyme
VLFGVSIGIKIFFMQIEYRSCNPEFVYPFTISKGTKTHQPTLIVKLQHFAWQGFGEAPAINYYNVTVEKMIAELEMKRKFIEKFAFTDPDRFWHFLHHLFPNNPFLVCALDMAGWDLYAKFKKQPLHQLLKLNINDAPNTDYTIGIDSVDRMVEKMKANPWPIYKVKVGVPGDIEMVKALRENTNAKIRVDANAGWSLAEAIEKVPQLKVLDVEFIEQPLAKDNWDGMRELLNQNFGIPFFADESCVNEKDVEKCKGYFNGINIKLTKCSGITPALRMIKNARSLGLQVMLGCMNESSIGSAAMAHLSPLVDYLDMDGPLLLKEDLATGLTINPDKISVSGEFGLGIQPTIF